MGQSSETNRNLKLGKYGLEFIKKMLCGIKSIEEKQDRISRASDMGGKILGVEGFENKRHFQSNF